MLATACGHGSGGAWRDDPGAADVRAFYYSDNSGIAVASLATTVDQPVARGLALELGAAAEQITIRRKPLDVGDPGADQSTGHPPHEPDAVTSASATAGGGAVADEVRVEGQVAARVAGPVAGRPATGRAVVRASTEPDYDSLYAGVGGSLELARRNTTLSGFAGAGRDHVDPVEAPPGQLDDWPASHVRVNGGLAVSQLLGPRLLVAGGAGLTYQHGQLASPYRRALVRTSLFPEVVPETRVRATGFAALSWSLGAATALHLRQGVYADTWGVAALIPEAALVRELGDRVLVSGRYRFYWQGAADFYEGRYHDLAPRLTGDPRLGPIVEHLGGAALRWTVRGVHGEHGAVAVHAAYELSVLDYQLLATDLILGHVASLGVAGFY